MRVSPSANGKVAMFKMRPRMGFIWMALVVALLGGLYVADLRSESVFDPGLETTARLVTLITVMLCIFLLVIATARMWYAHLWHRRK